MPPVPCSDHHLVWAEFTPLRTRGGSAYWHFSNRLLEDRRFRDSFERFWNTRKGKRGGFHSLRLRWDVGIQCFCQAYTRGSTTRRDSKIRQLGSKLLHFDSRLIQTVGDMILWREYQEKKKALKEQSQGAYVRSRIQLLHDLL